MDGQTAPAPTATATATAWSTRAAAGPAAGPSQHNWFRRLPPLGKLAAACTTLVVLGVLVTAALPGPSRCTYSCTAPTGPVQPAGQTYKGSLGYSFQYPGAMSIGSSNLGDQVTVEDPAGQMLIWVGKGQAAPSALVQTYAQKLAGTNMQDVRSFGSIPGAEIGFVPGDGEFFNAQLQDQNGQDSPVGIAVLAAQSGGTWAVAIVWSVCVEGRQPAVCSNRFFRSGGSFANGGDFDDVLARWHWPQ